MILLVRVSRVCVTEAKVILSVAEGSNQEAFLRIKLLFDDGECLQENGRMVT